MSDKIFIATLKVAVIGKNEPEAADAINGAMSATLQAEGLIIDWKYSGKNELQESQWKAEDFENENFDFTAFQENFKQAETAPEISDMFLPEWTNPLFNAMDKALIKHFKGKVLVTSDTGDEIPRSAFQDCAEIFGLAYTSSSSYAGYFCTNRDVYFDAAKQWRYHSFAIGIDRFFYAVIKDKAENFIVFKL